MEKPQGVSGKSSPQMNLKPRDFPKSNLRHSDSPRGELFQISPKAFPQSVFDFLEVQGHSSQGNSLEKVWKGAMRSVNCKSQIALIGNKSLAQGVFGLGSGHFGPWVWPLWVCLQNAESISKRIEEQTNDLL